MSTITQTSIRKFNIVQSVAGSGYIIEVFENGAYQGLLTRRDGTYRLFNSRSSARKAVTRELRGDYHR
jgi:hypothetical protein